MNASNGTIEEEWSNDYIYAGVILGVAGIIGCFSNGLGVYTVYKCHHLHNSFGYLCLSHCISNFGVCVTFAVWCSITTLLQAEAITSTEMGKHIGQVNILFWDACVYSHYSISINRFICIGFPLAKKNFFTPPVIGVFIIVPWILAVFHITPYFWSDECYIAYDAVTWLWNFAPTECGNLIAYYFDFGTGMLVLSLMILTDMGTLFNLRKLHQLDSMPNASNRELTKRRSLETKFFCQSLCQSAIFALELSSFYFISGAATTPWELFMLTSFAWVACHAADGCILDLFHSRKAFRSKRLARQSVSAVMLKVGQQSEVTH